jgi:hypothetical protein
MAKKTWLGMSAIVLTLGLSAVSCATISAENKGSFSTIKVPAKDFESLGLVFTENVIENNRGEVFTYNALLKEAKALGADAIVNVTIDVKREGVKLFRFYLSSKDTWYGSATAIKYKEGIINEVTIENKGSTAIATKESVIMSDSAGSSGDSSLETKKK